MWKRHYKFTDKKHNRQGFLSMACALCALIFTALALLLAYRRSGQAGSVVGLFGVLAMVLSIAGFVLAIRGFREEDTYLISCHAGVVLDGLLLILWALVCMIGM